jgi:endonuclease/exonuclease/phosphatase family metal-dependent hydrolase
MTPPLEVPTATPPATPSAAPDATAIAPPTAPALPQVQWLTLQVATCNLLNLAAPGHLYYPNQDPYDVVEAERKTAWLGAQFNRLNADALGVQEVWDESALRAAVQASGLRYTTAVAPGAELGASGTPRVGLVTRLPLLELESTAAFHAADHVLVPELGLQTRFERPVLRARLQTKHGQTLQVLVVHLKSKRPKFLQDAQGAVIEDRDDPAVVVRATLRSLSMRAAEACALRRLVVDITQRTREPLLLLGDMNDSPHAVTSQMIAANQAVGYDKGTRDTALFHAWDVQTEPALKRDVAYSHVHQGWPELLDQIWVSEEFVATSQRALGDVRRVDVFNDHLQESRERFRSDHGFVRALLRLRGRAP